MLHFSGALCGLTADVKILVQCASKWLSFAVASHLSSAVLFECFCIVATPASLLLVFSFQLNHFMAQSVQLFWLRSADVVSRSSDQGTCACECRSLRVRRLGRSAWTPEAQWHAVFDTGWLHMTSSDVWAVSTSDRQGWYPEATALTVSGGGCP